jgi:hypothetical protein
VGWWRAVSSGGVSEPVRPARHAGRAGLEPGDVLVRVGAVLFLIGAVAVFADFLPHPLSHQNRPLPLDLLAYSMAAGLGLALLGLVRMILAGRQQDPDLDPDAQPSVRDQR